MFIYVCGPYSPPSEETDPDKRKKCIESNIKKASDVAIALARKGHFPFTPHTMMHGWEDRYGISREITMRNCYQWIEKCDALFFIGSSPGAESELQVALELQISVYYSLDCIADASNKYEEKRNDNTHLFTVNHPT